jgi:BRCA1 C Terminus (BRCT) domain
MAADSQALHGVRVCVQLSKAAQASKHNRKLLEGELQDLGATCMQRLTKTCSYVIFQHKTDEPTEADRLADEQSVKDMAKKLAQVNSGPATACSGDSAAKLASMRTWQAFFLVSG